MQAGILFFLLGAVFRVTGHDIVCKKDFPNNGADFDLTPFAHRERYQVEDVVDLPGETDDFSYEFAVCANLDTLPVPNPPGVCHEALGGVGAAYQLLNNTRSGNGSCELLGTVGNQTWSLLDETDGTVGVKLSYLDGDACSGGRRRRFDMLFQCENRHTTEPSTNVDEPEGCSYTITFNSVFGCPTACIHGTTLCGNHGICSIDGGTQKAHCYCNTGYTGDKCQNTVTDQPQKKQGASPSAVLAAISLVLLVILLIMGIVLYLTIQKLKTEHSYGNFEQMVFEADGKDDDSV